MVFRMIVLGCGVGGGGDLLCLQANTNQSINFFLK